MLRAKGEKLKRSGTELEWRDGSQKVTIRGNLWFHQYERVGGDAVDFVRKFYGMNYPEAVGYLLNRSTVMYSSLLGEDCKSFELPKPNYTMRRVYDYLVHKRGVDKTVVDSFVIKRMIYESTDYHNAVFVGYDADGVPRHAHKRASIGGYRGNEGGSQPEFSFHWHGNSDRLYLFEAPIDMLSFISMHKADWQRHSYAASCGVASIVMHQMLKDNPNIRRVYLCHDNDSGGEKAAARIAAELADKGIGYERLSPVRKDWNEDLISSRREVQSCQALQN